MKRDSMRDNGTPAQNPEILEHRNFTVRKFVGALAGVDQEGAIQGRGAITIQQVRGKRERMSPTESA